MGLLSRAGGKSNAGCAAGRSRRCRDDRHALPNPPEACRTPRYLVEDVQAPQEEGADMVVSMACLEDDAIGARLTVLREQEIDFELLGESSWEAVAQRGFDQPRQFSAYLNTLRWNCVTVTDAELFQAP